MPQSSSRSLAAAKFRRIALKIAERSLCGPHHRRIAAPNIRNFHGPFPFSHCRSGQLSPLRLVGVILMQRSEGGGLGMGGSPSGLMSARGAADFMTRTDDDSWRRCFVHCCRFRSGVCCRAQKGGSSNIDTTLQRTEVPATPDRAPAQSAAPTTTDKAALRPKFRSTSIMPGKNCGLHKFILGRAGFARLSFRAKAS